MGHYVTWKRLLPGFRGPFKGDLAGLTVSGKCFMDPILSPSWEPDNYLPQLVTSHYVVYRKVHSKSMFPNVSHKYSVCWV